MKYATIKTNTVLSAISAPHIPPFIPARNALLNDITEAYAPTNSRRPPMTIIRRRCLSVIITSPKSELPRVCQGNKYFNPAAFYLIAVIVK